MQLTVSSWNIWDLYIVSKSRKKRIAAIINYIRDNPRDIVCLQELWIEKDYKQMALSWHDILPHSRHFKDGMLGSGLAIFSRFPIVTAHLSIFSTNGSPWRFMHGDWYSGKGVGMVAVSVPVDHDDIESDPTEAVIADGKNGNSKHRRTTTKHIAIFNMHVHAEYGPKREAMLGTRLVQLRQARLMIDSITCNYDAVVVCGDFNTKPEELPFAAYFEEDLGVCKHLRDHGAEVGTEGLPTEGMNEYSRGRRPKRIDYILSHNTRCLEYAVVDVKDPAGMSLSDHALLTATLHLDPNIHISPCQRRDHTVTQSMAHTQSRIRAILQGDLEKRQFQSRLFFAIWALLMASSIGFGAYSIVTVYIPNYPRTISLMLYIFFPIVIIVSDYFFFLWLFARADVKVFERVLFEV